MPMIPTWAGVITAEGTLRLEARGLFRKYLTRLKGQPVTVIVKRQSTKKSRNQLGYLFGVVYPVIADTLGYRQYEVDQVHDAVVRVVRGLKAEPNPLGLRWSLAEQDHAEASRYIEDVRHWALTEYGIVTPDSGEVEAA